MTRRIAIAVFLSVAFAFGLNASTTSDSQATKKPAKAATKSAKKHAAKKSKDSSAPAAGPQVPTG
ncbi:MAG: hypothetical protein ACXVJT_07580, partial [Thermoanaerobaculia bacterium]